MWEAKGKEGRKGREPEEEGPIPASRRNRSTVEPPDRARWPDAWRTKKELKWNSQDVETPVRFREGWKGCVWVESCGF
jgi:hypothetical protein